MKNVKKWLASPEVEGTIRILIVISIIFSIVLYIEQYQLASCTVRYHQDNAIVQKARAVAAAEDNEAQDDFFRALHDAIRNEDENSRTDIDIAFKEYFQKRAQAEESRAANTIPDLVSDYC